MTTVLAMILDIPVVINHYQNGPIVIYTDVSKWMMWS